MTSYQNILGNFVKIDFRIVIFSMNFNQPLRPGPYAEHQIIEHILNGHYPPGSVLPAERKLADQLGVTRPTIRETLQRLAGDGWITIRHGKPTQINYFWETGGLRLLATLVKYGSYLPESFIEHLLELRVMLNPPIARQAVKRAPEAITNHLARCRQLEAAPQSFTEFDWTLQQLMARHSGNPVHLIILNDFRTIFKTMATVYFSRKDAREASLSFYKTLNRAIADQPETVEPVVRNAMEKSIDIWKRMKASKKEEPNVSMERMGR